MKIGTPVEILLDDALNGSSKDFRVFGTVVDRGSSDDTYLIDVELGSEIYKVEVNKHRLVAR